MDLEEEGSGPLRNDLQQDLQQELQREALTDLEESLETTIGPAGVVLQREDLALEVGVPSEALDLPIGVPGILRMLGVLGVIGAPGLDPAVVPKEGEPEDLPRVLLPDLLGMETPRSEVD